MLSGSRHTNEEYGTDGFATVGFGGNVSLWPVVFGLYTVRTLQKWSFFLTKIGSDVRFGTRIFTTNTVNERGFDKRLVVLVTFL